MKNLHTAVITLHAQMLDLCKAFKHGNLQFYHSGVSISTDDRRNASVSLLRAVGYFFSEKEATCFNNVLNKKYIIKSELKRKLNYDVFSRPTGMLYQMSVWLHNAVFQSIFATFNHRFTQNLSMCKCTSI